MECCSLKQRFWFLKRKFHQQKRQMARWKMMSFFWVVRNEEMQLGSGDVQKGSLDLVVQSQVVICSSPKVRPASVPDHQPLLVLRPTKTL